MYNIGDKLQIVGYPENIGSDLSYAKIGDVVEVVYEVTDMDQCWISRTQVMKSCTEWAEVLGWVFKLVEYSSTEETPVRNKYMREIAPDVWVDVYDVLYAFGVTDPCLQHLIKKALATGVRGHKSEREDLVDIVDSAKRAVEHYDRFNKS